MTTKTGIILCKDVNVRATGIHLTDYFNITNNINLKFVNLYKRPSLLKRILGA